MNFKKKLVQLWRKLGRAFSRIFQNGKLTFLRAGKKLNINPLHKDLTQITIPIGSANKEDLTVKVENGYLLVSAEKQQHSKHRSSMGWSDTSLYSSVQHMFPIPANIKASDIEARLKGSNLELTLPAFTGDSFSTKRIAIS